MTPLTSPRPLWRNLAVALCCTTPLLALAAPEPTLPDAQVRMTPAQVQGARIRTQRVGAASASLAPAAANATSNASAGQANAPAAAPGITLSGMAVLPPQAIQTLSAPLAGFVQQVHIGPTDAVRAGQVVAQLHSTELLQWQREAVQASAQARAAADRLARSERLYAEGIVPEARVRDDRYTHTQAQVALAERRQALRLAGLGDAQIRTMMAGNGSAALLTQIPVVAPRAGTVMEVLASPGQRLEAGAPVATLARSGLLALELQATPDQAARIAPGAAVSVAGCAQPGRVRGVATQVRGGNQALMVHVDLSAASGSPCLRANQAVSATVFESKAASAPAGIQHLATVSIASLVRHQGRDLVFVKNRDGFAATPVQVLGRSGSTAQVSGLPAGAEVAVQGVSALKGAWLGMGEAEGDGQDAPQGAAKAHTQAPATGASARAAAPAKPAPTPQTNASAPR